MHIQGEHRTVSAEQLSASNFEHVETRTLIHPKKIGVTQWQCTDVTARWSWQTANGIVVVANPMQIQINAQLVDEDGHQLTASQRACVLMRLLHRLPWQQWVASALEALTDPASVSMSDRELECLYLSGLGNTVQGAALALGISQHTVASHLRRAAEKLGQPSRWQAVLTATQLGII